MKKYINVFRIICIVCWTVAVGIAIIRPDINFRICFICAGVSLIFQNLVEFIGEGDKHVGKVERPDNES